MPTPPHVQRGPGLTWWPGFRKKPGPAAGREATRFFTMHRFITAFMLIGGLAASQNANAEPVEIDDTTLRISSFGEDEAGELYILSLDGSIYRFVPR